MVYGTAKIGRIHGNVNEKSFEVGISVSELMDLAGITKGDDEEIRVMNTNELVETDDLVKGNTTYLIVPNKAQINGSQ